ncbi:MAG: hypothetical protein KDB23_04660 [Planctomycetales bacterium]|nr:hypothetical protein [Planctomycetales bacterium]
MRHRNRFSVLFPIIAGIALTTLSGQVRPSLAAKTTPPTSARLQELVTQLGADEYSVRQRAQAELRQYGVAAFEVLDAAKNHPDVEIRKQAEYLLHAIHINWVDDNSAEEVRRLVALYQTEDAEIRRARLVQISLTDGEPGLRVLSRLVRFETSDDFSRRAALAILRRSTAVREMGAQQFRETVEQQLGGCDRAAAQWLLLYAREAATGELKPDDWQRMIRTELALLEKRPERERMAIVRELLQWQVELAQDRQQESLMRGTLQQLLSLQAVDEPQLRTLLDWLIDRKAWSLVAAVDETFAEMIDHSPSLLYRRAELWEQQNKREQLTQLLDKLLNKQFDPPPVKLDDVDRGEVSESYITLASDLQSHGRFDWAEREFRQAMKVNPPDSLPAVDASFRLGYMLFDLGRYDDAYEVMNSLATQLLNEPGRKSLRQLQELTRIPGYLFSHWHLSHSYVLAVKNDVEGQQKALRQALEYDNENADILIAMYRVEGADENWQKETRQRIDRLRGQYEKHVATAERDYETQRSEVYAIVLAQQLNQLAWLVSNTYGDYEQAVRHSHRSLELAPEESGYLDTLGRCYFAVKDYRRAVRYQRHAVELDPHSGQIVRQLEVFQQALAAANAATPAE